MADQSVTNASAAQESETWASAQAVGLKWQNGPKRMPEGKPMAALHAFYVQAAKDLTEWLERYRDLAVGAKHVQSARRQIERRLEELEEEA